jgi:hypothetical protein
VSQPSRPANSSEPPSDRPQLTPGYGIETSREGLLPWSYVSEHMAAARNYWVATTRPDGRPHSAPVWGLWLDETFYFSTDPDSTKARNLTANPATVVHLESGDDVVILEGIVGRVTKTTALTRFVDLYEAKYGIRPDPSDPGQGVYQFKAHTALAWREQDMPKSATRWNLRDKRR